MERLLSLLLRLLVAGALQLAPELLPRETGPLVDHLTKQVAAGPGQIFDLDYKLGAHPAAGEFYQQGVAVVLTMRP